MIEIEIGQEVIAIVIGTVGTIMLTLLTALLWAVRGIMAASKTNIAFNNEIQEHSAYRVKAEQAQDALRAKTDTLTAEIKAVKVDCATRENEMKTKITDIEARASEREAEMQAKITSLNEKINELETEVARLQRALEVERNLRRDDLAAFQKQINEKNAQIAELRAERDKLQSRVTALETAMNGKADKHPTDDIAAAAEKVTARFKTPPVTGEAGEHTKDEKNKEQ